MDKIDTAAVQAHAEHLKERDLAPSTRQLRVEAIRAFSKWAKDSIALDVADNIEFPTISAGRKPPIASHEDEVEQLLDELTGYGREKYQGLVMLLFDVGLRISPALQLQWGDIECGDSNGWQVSVTRKGNKSQYLPIIGDRLVEWIEEYRATDDVYIFHGRDPMEPLDRQVVNSVIGRACERAGIRHLHPHAFRHGFARRATIRGVPTAAVQRFLGHASSDTTDRYLSTMDTDVRGLREAMQGT